MSKKQEDRLDVDIYQLLQESSEKRKKEKRTQLLKSIGVKEYFEEGSISINKKTCKGVECKLCIEACPTHALYWMSGEVGIVEDLCIFCTACVWNCIVDGCIHVQRRRPNGEVEEFSNPREVLTLLHKINAKERRGRAKSRLEWAREIPPVRRMRCLPAFLRRGRFVKEWIR